jgi:hypothetical protein
MDRGRSLNYKNPGQAKGELVKAPEAHLFFCMTDFQSWQILKIAGGTNYQNYYWLFPQD